jgi:hypothetical protein
MKPKYTTDEYGNHTASVEESVAIILRGLTSEDKEKALRQSYKVFCMCTGMKKGCTETMQIITVISNFFGMDPDVTRAWMEEI